MYHFCMCHDMGLITDVTMSAQKSFKYLSYVLIPSTTSRISIDLLLLRTRKYPIKLLNTVYMNIMNNMKLFMIPLTGIICSIVGISGIYIVDDGTYCKWCCIKCDKSNFITEIDLTGNNLTGTFDESIILLSFQLESLKLANNNISGTTGQRYGAPANL